MASHHRRTPDFRIISFNLRAGCANVKTVTGQVKAIDGQTSTIREQSGNEVSLKIDSETKLDGLINMGDRVTASVEPNGRVMSLKQLSNESSTKIIR
ncbi:MAG: hypothetical protein C4293_00180 [Nitrospiraceae bacterium]